ncbi:MAG TPA: hypothetical protein VKY73_05585, partial [Polyangiaceae bacterium]|nr:hypothetical protein [Polyangiaceae bacterium]
MSAGFAFRRRNGLVSSVVLLNVFLASAAYAKESSAPANEAIGTNRARAKSEPAQRTARPAPKHGPLAALVPEYLPSAEGKALASVRSEALHPRTLARPSSLVGQPPSTPSLVTGSVNRAEQLQAQPDPAQPAP